MALSGEYKTIAKLRLTLPPSARLPGALPFRVYDAAQLSKYYRVSEPVVIELAVNGRTQDVIIPEGDWGEIPLKPMPSSHGANRLKILVKTGTAHLDWIAFE